MYFLLFVEIPVIYLCFEIDTYSPVLHFSVWFFCFTLSYLVLPLKLGVVKMLSFILVTMSSQAEHLGLVNSMNPMESPHT